MLGVSSQFGGFRTALLFGFFISCGAEFGAEADDPPRASPEPLLAVQVQAGPGTVPLIVPERWGTLKLSLMNPHEAPVELLCTTMFDGRPTLQYGRTLWVPPQSRLKTYQPIRVPKVSDPNQQLVDLQSLVMDTAHASETLLPQAFGNLKLEHWLRLAARSNVVAIYDHAGPAAAGDSRRISISDYLLTVRTDRRFSQNLVSLADELLPPCEEALDAVDHLVIADERLIRDPAGLTATRHWLYDGGRLWVMLDRVDAALLEYLLGDDFTGQEVDRIGLTHVEFESTRPTFGAATIADFDLPVELVRVLIDDVDTTYNVNGWPAAFWKSCGRGRLLVTTLGADAWVRRRDPSDRASRGGSNQQTDYVMHPELELLTAQFFQQRSPVPLPFRAAEDYAGSHIGYATPSRGLVVSLLTISTLLLTGIAGWLFRNARLEQFAWCGPVVALFTGGALVVAGYNSRSAIPRTTTVLQFVQPMIGTHDVEITGTAAIFTPEGGLSEFSGSHGGWILPDMSGTEGTTRRLVWDDFDRWHWDNVPRSPGVHTAAFHEVQRLSAPVQVTASLDGRGLKGRMDLPDGLQPSDAILVTPTGRLGVDIQPHGAFQGSADRVLTFGQFLSADILSDEQDRRNRTLSAMLDNKDYPQQPTLLFWTNPWDIGLHFLDKSRSAGSALVSLPMSLTRPVPGTQITIPSPLLPYREGYGPDGLVPSGFYDPRRHQWTPKHSAIATWLQIEPPASLLPLEPQTARLIVQVSGPMRRLAIDGVKKGEVSPIKTWIDPVGTLTLEITDPDVLALSKEGRLMLRIAGGDPDQAEAGTDSTGRTIASSYWQIESLTLELEARVSEGTAGKSQRHEEERLP